jgi:NMD protein affecting ribosome stability and mRNA decay
VALAEAVRGKDMPKFCDRCGEVAKGVGATCEDCVMGTKPRPPEPEPLAPDRPRRRGRKPSKRWTAMRALPALLTVHWGRDAAERRAAALERAAGK